MAQHDGGERDSQPNQAPGRQAAPGSSGTHERALPLARSTLERRAHLDDNDEEIWNRRERVSSRAGLGRGGER